MDDKIINAFEGGMTPYEIYVKFNVTIEHVYNVLKENDVKNRDK